jgi:hypothetical protein
VSRADGGSGARLQDGVFGDQGAVEVARERRDVTREVAGKPQLYCVTKAATSAIS